MSIFYIFIEVLTELNTAHVRYDLWGDRDKQKTNLFIKTKSRWIKICYHEITDRISLEHGEYKKDKCTSSDEICQYIYKEIENEQVLH